MTMQLGRLYTDPGRAGHAQQLITIPKVSDLGKAGSTRPLEATAGQQCLQTQIFTDKVITLPH